MTVLVTDFPGKSSCIKGRGRGRQSTEGLKVALFSHLSCRGFPSLPSISFFPRLLFFLCVFPLCILPIISGFLNTRFVLFFPIRFFHPSCVACSPFFASDFWHMLSFLLSRRENRLKFQKFFLGCRLRLSDTMSLNSRLKTLCRELDVRFLDSWDSLYGQVGLFQRDGLPGPVLC